jgi:hypothetical protein
MIVDYTAETLPPSMRTALESYGEDLWFFRERTDGHGTTRAVNRYRGDTRMYVSPLRSVADSLIRSQNDGRGRDTASWTRTIAATSLVMVEWGKTDGQIRIPLSGAIPSAYGPADCPDLLARPTTQCHPHDLGCQAAGAV